MKTLKIMKEIKTLEFSQGVTACIAALSACLAIQKNKLRDEPLAWFFVTPNKQINQLYKLFN